MYEYVPLDGEEIVVVTNNKFFVFHSVVRNGPNVTQQTCYFGK